MLVGGGEVEALAIVHIYGIFLIAKHHSPRLVGYLDIARIYLCLGFGVQVFL